MPFGLTNAPATFQSLMNDIFQTLLRRYVLVFFDDILVCSRTWTEHLSYLEKVFSILLSNQLYVNQSKCLIRKREMEYLGHIISEARVSADPKKICSIEAWPVPTNATALRGFLGLTDYYWKFIQGYGAIAAPSYQALEEKWFPMVETSRRIFS